MNIVIQRRIIIIELKYINLQEKEQLLKENPKVKRLSKLIDQHNTTYIDNLRKKINILNNINGYPLDDYQSRVVLSNEKATLVVAGAGSGKSLTIIGKIVYLVISLLLLLYTLYYEILKYLKIVYGMYRCLYQSYNSFLYCFLD